MPLFGKKEDDEDDIAAVEAELKRIGSLPAGPDPALGSPARARQSLGRQLASGDSLAAVRAAQNERGEFAATRVLQGADRVAVAEMLLAPLHER